MTTSPKKFRDPKTRTTEEILEEIGELLEEIVSWTPKEEAAS
jgi:hypothetical protein